MNRAYKPLGVASLVASLAGIFLGAAALLVARLGLLPEPTLVLVIGTVAFLVLELFALAAGIATRRTRPGAAGLTVSAIAIVLFAAAFALLYPASVTRS
jgi:hypothetical protein